MTGCSGNRETAAARAAELDSLAVDLRAQVAAAMEKDRAESRHHPKPWSKKWDQLYRRRGHGYGAVLAVAAQVERRAEALAASLPVLPETREEPLACCGDHNEVSFVDDCLPSNHCCTACPAVSVVEPQPEAKGDLVRCWDCTASCRYRCALRPAPLPAETKDKT